MFRFLCFVFKKKRTAELCVGYSSAKLQQQKEKHWVSEWYLNGFLSYHWRSSHKPYSSTEEYFFIGITHRSESEREIKLIFLFRHKEIYGKQLWDLLLAIDMCRNLLVCDSFCKVERSLPSTLVDPKIGGKKKKLEIKTSMKMSYFISLSVLFPKRLMWWLRLESLLASSPWMWGVVGMSGSSFSFAPQ